MHHTTLDLQSTPSLGMTLMLQLVCGPDSHREPRTCRPMSLTASSSATPTIGPATPANFGRTARSDDQAWPTFARRWVSGGAWPLKALPAQHWQLHQTKRHTILLQMMIPGYYLLDRNIRQSSCPAGGDDCWC